VSFVGSMALMPVLVGALPPVPANLVTIAACGLVNYLLGDGSVFHRVSTDRGQGSGSDPCPPTCGNPVENRPVP
jgi:hypothetical protein